MGNAQPITVYKLQILRGNIADGGEELCEVTASTPFGSISVGDVVKPTHWNQQPGSMITMDSEFEVLEIRHWIFSYPENVTHTIELYVK